MFYSTDEMSKIFSRENHIRAMLRFEAALASAEARAGVIPVEAARAIADGADSFSFDTDTLFRDAVRTATLTTPLAKALTEHVGPDAGAYVHWGATSQDTIDTAFMLQNRSGITLLEERALRIAEVLAKLADTHRATPMIGRTLSQQALPITLGLKAARWLSMFTRGIERLREVKNRSLAIQFGGAVGTLASLGSNGIQVQQYLAEELELNLPDLPWHTERDRLVEISSVIGIVAGSVLKIADDLLLLAQTEIGEVSERSEPGKGGSSAMPHKRNPVDLIGASAAARLATETASGFFYMMNQAHERSAGVWQSEWEPLPNLFQSTDYALERLTAALEGLQIHIDRMQANLNLTNGLIMAESLAMRIAEKVGRIEGYRLVHAASQRVLETGKPMMDVCLEDDAIREVLGPDEIEHALDPAGYLGSTDIFIANALSAFAAVQPGLRRE